MSVRAIGMALEVTGVSTRAKLVLIGLANCASDETFECFPGRKHLAKVGDCSVDTVDRALKELAENHIIEITHQWVDVNDRIPTANSYRLFPWYDPSRKIAATPDALAAAVRPGATADMRPPSREIAATVAARDAATNEPSVKQVVAVAWAGRLKEAQARAGAACNLTSGHVHHFADLKRLEAGGCDWEADILPAIDALAAGILANGRKPLNSWAHPGLIDAATTLRNRRLNGLPAIPKNGVANGRGSHLPTDDDWARAADEVERNAADRAREAVALGHPGHGRA